MVIFLHGNGGSGRASAFESKLNRIADSENFIAVYPDGYKKSWNDARNKTIASKEGINDILFLNELIKTLINNYPVNERKIYLAGVSNGGFMVQTFVFNTDVPIAAIASIIATFPKNLDITCNLNNISIMYILGTKDPYVPYNGGTVAGKNSGEVYSANESINFWKKKNNCSEDIKIKIYPDIKNDNVNVKKITYSECNNTEVVLIKMINGGHQYPNGIKIPTAGNKCRDINATKEIWMFFSKHSSTRNN